MNVSLVTMRPAIADKKTNLATMKKHIQKLQTDLIIFGEMNLTGYRCKDELRDLAEPLNGPSIKTITTLAQQENKHVIFGMPLLDEHRRGLIYNAAILVHPTGKVDIYRKMFLPNFGPFKEKLYFDEGETIPVFKTSIGTIGILICYELFFPEIAKALSLQGADIIICISASPSVTRSYFETLLPARAIENTTFFIYTNIVGPQEDLIFWGGSQIYNPLGILQKKSPYFKESTISCDI
ncbi:MAG: carbon-nitrogen hydrolase family protein, partial [Candidatus Heimdallarchaeota archaeon]|nr:carbon-nitrogen hydrolase family protein [Candidatus Heimdallarchaeota archaeon]